jgi:hypothetical protein
MMTLCEPDSPRRLRNRQLVGSVEGHITTLEVLCQLLDAATDQFDLAVASGDDRATADALHRLRAISTEIDTIIPRQFSPGDAP